MRTTDKKVVVLSTDPWLNRLHGASVLDLFKFLASYGYKVRILLPSHDSRRIEKNSFSVFTLKSKNYVPLLTFVSLFRRAFGHLTKSQPDVLIFDFPMAPLFLLFRIFVKVKGIMLILSRPVGEGGFRGWFRFLHFRLSLMIWKPFVNAFTAISPFEASEFSRLGKIPREKVVVVPSPLGDGFESFDPSENVNELRSRLGFNALLRKKVLLYNGVLDEKRGVVQLLELFIESFKGNDEVVLLLVGDGPARGSIKALIQQSDVSNITLVDAVPYSEMPELIAACDVGVVLLPNHPWWRFQTPTKLIEFLALGKLVIASNLPGIRWIGSHSTRVTYLRQLNWHSFRGEVNRLMLDSKKTAADAIRIRQEMINRFSSKSVALKLSQMIDSL